ncbi:L,D-transpeptidase [Conexibacter sp. CPCC 206217]|uniref:L,D-transpeptidase n=1 Tax=Conexibacter sp. CPCC 206217 TaxID=3064574 RepID=UPI0027251E2F|nr:L,D-transpeptidase [Conexibacter sp. CPCC 206217]MDO8213950.1 L,D-transpeptidase [Conexibacter sp. CPCC 206217]
MPDAPRVRIAGIAAACAAAVLALLPAGATAATPNLARILFATKATAAPGGGRLLARLEPFAPLGRGEAQYAVTARRVVGGRLFVRVLLARRPNGSAGWVPGDDVALEHTSWRVGIDLRARRVTVVEGNRVVNVFPAVVGRDSSPTPRGQFAISELLPQRPATGFFGGWVFPLTAFSDTYTEFQGGPGRVAIHGRGGASLLDPLGTASSHGCIRIANTDANWLANHLEAGVPVTIR